MPTGIGRMFLPNNMKAERFVIQLKDVKVRQPYAPVQRAVSSKKIYKRREKYGKGW
jgi:hypothetical protein